MMFMNRSLRLTEKLMHDGQTYVQPTRTMIVRDLFCHMHWIFNHCTHTIDHITKQAIIISYQHGIGSYMNVWIKAGKKHNLVSGKDVTITIEGDAGDLAPLIEYMFWSFPRADIPPHLAYLKQCADTLTSTMRSRLPQLVISRVFNTPARDVDWLSLAMYDISEKDVAELKKNPRRGWLRDLAAANDLWVESGSGTFGDFLRELGLLTTHSPQAATP